MNDSFISVAVLVMKVSRKILNSVKVICLS